MALYLKYRPLDFSSLVGQDFIKSTLKAAVSGDKTVGAYIFTGPRGTGKTSTARIFAKAINCESPKDGDPDLTCSVCQSFANENLIDVIEIDAASHTGVDNIREIIEKAQFRPTQSKYKIYIIDEVHMLSKGAFNALLKILEEPPVHVKFILATTEIHKVPDTILSRCQRYDFKNFNSGEITNRLKFIAESEGVQVDDASYEYIVKSAEGGMRNAVSLFEQLISNNTISYDYIVETLGVMSEDEKTNFITKLISREPSILDDFDAIASSGKNLKIFFKDILSLIQAQCITAIQSGNDISKSITIMDVLSDTLMKSKNSFDEVITYRIGLLKIISSYVAPNGVSTLQANTITSPTTQAQKIIEPTKTTGKTAPAVEDDIVASAEDIFAIDSPDVGSLPNKAPESFGSGGGDIDIAELISATKAGGGKAALSMTIKGSEFDLDGDVLHIKAKTSIARNTLNKTENRDILFLALEKIEKKVSDIKVT